MMVVALWTSERRAGHVVARQLETSPFCEVTDTEEYCALFKPTDRSTDQFDEPPAAPDSSRGFVGLPISFPCTVSRERSTISRSSGCTEIDPDTSDPEANVDRRACRAGSFAESTVALGFSDDHDLRERPRVIWRGSASETVISTQLPLTPSRTRPDTLSSANHMHRPFHVYAP